APNDRRDPALRRLFQLLLRHELREHRPRRDLPVADRGKELLALPVPILAEHGGERRTVGQPLQVQTVAARFLLEQLSSELEAALLLLCLDVMLDLVARARGDDEVEPVAAGLMAGR